MHESVPPAPAGATRGPAWGFLVLAVLACAVFVRLGFWQWDKGQVREAQWARFARGAEVLVDLDNGATADIALYQRVRANGTFDAQHQFLLDNRSYRGTPGYEVLTPLVRSGAAPLLVDRGWVPFSGSRQNLPDVSVPGAAAVSVTGRLSTLPSSGLAMGRAAPAPGPWPKVTSFPDMAELSGAYGTALEPLVLLLDPGQAAGYVRDWQPPGIAPLRHFSYAIQWWSFAALTVFLWGLLTYRNRRAVVKI
jgi:surfeit locus 1 family protein